jgi:hypothetical protein
MTRRDPQGGEIMFMIVVLGVVFFVCAALMYALFHGLGLL